MTSNNARLAALLCAIGTAAALRLVPHPANFSPIDAIALFSGAHFGRRALAFLAPLCALLLSDILLGFYPGMLFQYAAVALVVLIGSLALAHVSVLRLVGAVLSSSVLFFAISNFGVWMVSGMYPHSFIGLGTCFAAGIPFFQNSLAGDIFYVTLLFGGFSIASRLLPQIKGEEAQLA